MSWLTEFLRWKFGSDKGKSLRVATLAADEIVIVGQPDGTGQHHEMIRIGSDVNGVYLTFTDDGPSATGMVMRRTNTGAFFVRCFTTDRANPEFQLTHNPNGDLTVDFRDKTGSVRLTPDLVRQLIALLPKPSPAPPPVVTP